MENNLDKLFKSTLEGQEPEFRPAAWDRMEGILNEEGLLPSQKKKPNRSLFIYFAVLFIGIALSIFGYQNLNSVDHNQEGSTLIDSKMNSKQLTSQTDKKSSINKEKTAIKNDAEVVSHIKKEDNSQNIQSYPSTVKSKTPNNNTHFKEIKETQILKSEFDAIENKDIDPITQDKQTLPQLIIENNETETETEKDKTRTIDSGRVAPIEIDKSNSDDIAVRLGSIESANQVLIGENNDYKSDALTPLNEKENDVKSIADDKTIDRSISVLDKIDTRTADLLAGEQITIPKVILVRGSKFSFGIESIVRYNSGLGFAMGPYVSYNVGSGYSIEFGGQFDAQNTENGPQLSVFDKVYSFGSTLDERTFTLSNQKSLRIPLSVSKSFDGFDLSTGLVFYKIFASEGDINKGGDINTVESAIVENKMIRSMNLSFQMEASINLNRFFEVGIGLEYRTKAFVEDESVTNNSTHIYPTLGLKYNLFNF